MPWNRSPSPAPEALAAMQVLQREVSEAVRAGSLNGAHAPMERLRALAMANPVVPEVCDAVGRACEDVANAAIGAGNLEAAQYGFDLCRSLLKSRPADESLMMHIAAIAWSATCILCDRADPDHAAAYGNALCDLKPRSRDGCWQLQLWFTRCTARCVEACIAKGAAAEAARVTYEFRDNLVSPWFHDDLIERHGRAKADTMRKAFGAQVGAWLAAHPDIAAKGAGRIVEPYDFADEAEANLWNGALRIRLPRRYVAERQSSVRFECDEPGVDCPTVSFEVASVASAVGRNAADAARDAQSCLRTAAMAGRGQYRHLLCEVPGNLLPGIYSQYDCQDDERGDEVRDWLVARNWYLLRASRNTIFILGVGIIGAAFQEGRDDVQAFILQFERALGDMTIDTERLCREAGLE